MSLWIDLKFLKQITYRLDGFKEARISPYLGICRCPICGDSKKNKRKKRGGFFEKGHTLFYKCMNCMPDEVMHFSQFLKWFDNALWNVYRLESFKDSKESLTNRVASDTRSFEEKLKASFTGFTSQIVASLFRGTTRLSDLPEHHPAKQYVNSRMLPETLVKSMYYVDEFYKWAVTNTDRFQLNEDHKVVDHPRIIIPWFNRDGDVFAYSARSLNGESPKYYMIVLDEGYPKFYGLGKLDFDKKIYVVEGPVDSSFLPNCVAVGSAALTTFENDNAVYCWDNEKRNPDIVKLMTKAAKAGKKIFIPPDTYKAKDINDAVLTGMSVQDIIEMIDTNTFQGLAAVVRLNKWKKSEERKLNGNRSKNFSGLDRASQS